MPSLLDPLSRVPLVFLDVETTGSTPTYGHRVIEIGVVRVENGKVSAEYEQLVDPQRDLPSNISSFTGIWPGMLAGQPTFASQMSQLVNIVRGGVIVGHNIKFDLEFLSHEFRIAETEMSAHWPKAMVLDTLPLARTVLKRRRNALQRLAAELDLRPTCAHRALPDCHTTFRLFEKLIVPLGGWNTPLVDVFQRAGRPTVLRPEPPQKKQAFTPVGFQSRLPFGGPASA